MQDEIIRLGKYTLSRQLGTGAFGRVYQASDPLGRTVALKVLKTGLESDPQTMDRFRREARVAGELFHQHIATILDFDEVEGRFFLVMRYVDGLSLDALIAQKGTLGWDEALVILRQVASALDYAHAHGYVHRDVKPQNILVSSNEGAVLTDFGLVRAAEASGGSSSAAFLGTPHYIAPEIWLGNVPGPAADVYSLACVAYEMLTGRQLFPGQNTPEVMTRHVLHVPPLPDVWPGDVPAAVKGVFLCALEKDYTRRTVSAGAFVQELTGLQNALYEKERSDELAQLLQQVNSLKDGLQECDNDLEQSRRGLEAYNNDLEKAKKDAALDKAALAEAKQNTTRLEGELARKNREIADLHKRVGEGALPWRWVLPALTVLVVLGVLAGALIAAGQAVDPPSTGSAVPTSAAVVDMVLVPAGTFLMGNNDGNDDEKPQQAVTLPAFYMDQYEVTTGLYKQCVDAGVCQAPVSTGSATRADYFGNLQFENYPVINVSWDMANVYCKWRGARLPSEAEWEYAARGTDGRTYPWGEGMDRMRANYGGGAGNPVAVGSYKWGASPFGIYDMAGNVWEWVDGWYQAYPGNTIRNMDYGAIYRVMRGGAWDDLEYVLASSNRLRNIPSQASNFVGFRCASDSTP